MRCSALSRANCSAGTVRFRDQLYRILEFEPGTSVTIERIEVNEAEDEGGLGSRTRYNGLEDPV